jgi:hypothetical protein
MCESDSDASGKRRPAVNEVETLESNVCKRAKTAPQKAADATPPQASPLGDDMMRAVVELLDFEAIAALAMVSSSLRQVITGSLGSILRREAGDERGRLSLLSIHPQPLRCLEQLGGAQSWFPSAWAAGSLTSHLARSWTPKQCAASVHFLNLRPAFQLFIARDEEGTSSVQHDPMLGVTPTPCVRRVAASAQADAELASACYRFRCGTTDLFHVKKWTSIQEQVLYFNEMFRRTRGVQCQWYADRRP